MPEYPDLDELLQSGVIPKIGKDLRLPTAGELTVEAEAVGIPSVSDPREFSRMVYTAYGAWVLPNGTALEVTGEAEHMLVAETILFQWLVSVGLPPDVARYIVQTYDVYSPLLTIGSDRMAFNTDMNFSARYVTVEIGRYDNKILRTVSGLLSMSQDHYPTNAIVDLDYIVKQKGQLRRANKEIPLSAFLTNAYDEKVELSEQDQQSVVRGTSMWPETMWDPYDPDVHANPQACLELNDIPDSQFDAKALRKGIQAELEHTSDREIAKSIAKDHLLELPDYYDRLEEMERGG